MSGKRRWKYVSADRALGEYCHDYEVEKLIRWSDFKFPMALLSAIPPRFRQSALQDVCNLVKDSPDYGYPNICMSRDAVRALLAASRLPRSTVRIIEVGAREEDAAEIMSRESVFPVPPESAGEKPLGIMEALRLDRRMSGQGELLGVEPWLLDRRLRHSWRGTHDSRVTTSRAFSRLNEYGLLADFIDFQLFLPGLMRRQLLRNERRWIPLALVQHPVEVLIGDARSRTLYAAG
jgi:hypothetical protein